MTASLIAAGLYELIGGVVNPEYRLQAGGLGLGDGEPDTATLSSLLLDGDVVTGERTKNRHVSLRVKVIGSTRLDLTSKIDLLRSAVDSATWALTYTPDGGLPIIFDCYRATTTRERPQYLDGILETFLTFSFEASPFGRSPDLQSVTVTARSQVDSFDTAPTGATLDTTNKAEGTGSAKVTGTLASGTYAPGAAITRSFAARDYSAFANFTVQERLQYPSNKGGANVTKTLTLTSASGSTTYPAVSTAFSWFGDLGAVWKITSIPLSGGVVTAGTGATLTAVTSYTLASSAVGSGFGFSPPSTLAWNFDDLEASGSSSALTSTTRGTLLLVPNIIGSARTPVSLAATGTINALLAHRPPSWQDANAQILTAVTVAASPSTPTATTIAANSARFAGTYAAVLGVSVNGAAGANTVSLTVTQLENGVSVATKVLTATYTSPQADGLVKLKDANGQDLVLPLRATPADNTLTTYTLAFNHSAGADQYSDFMLIDTRGQYVIADPPSAAAAVYIDAPVPPSEASRVYASAGGRTSAYSIDDTSVVIGPFNFDAPGDNRLLIWSDTAAPTVTATYPPLWQDERPV